MNETQVEEMIRNVVNANISGINAGANAAEQRMLPALRVLEQQFFAALVDKETVMKSSLQIAILAVLMMVPSAITQRVNAYATQRIKDDAAGNPRPEYDTTTWGTPLKAGS